MKVRAAVARQAGKTLSLETVDLAGPREGEVLVEIKATGICHTDEFTLSGADPEGIFPAILGHEGAGVVVEVGAGVRSLKPGDHVIPLYTPECRECEYCLSRKTNLCQSIRITQGRGQMPDGTSRFSCDGVPVMHYMGTSTFANFTVVPEIALAKIREDAPFDKVCYIGCGVTTGVGAVINTAKVEPGARVVVFGLGGIGAERGAGRAAGRGGDDRRRGHEPRPPANGRALRHDPFRQPEGGRGGPGAVPRQPDQGRRGLQLRVHRQCRRDARGAGVLPQGLGRIDHHRRGGGRAGDPHPAVPARHRRVWKGSAFGGARGRTDVPRIVDWYMDGKIEIDPLITHVLPFEQINEGFELMRRGESIRTVLTY